MRTRRVYNAVQHWRIAALLLASSRMLHTCIQGRLSREPRRKAAAPQNRTGLED